MVVGAKSNAHCFRVFGFSKHLVPDQRSEFFTSYQMVVVVVRVERFIDIMQSTHCEIGVACFLRLYSLSFLSDAHNQTMNSIHPKCYKYPKRNSQEGPLKDTLSLWLESNLKLTTMIFTMLPGPLL